jgi:hypothetical protein
VAEPPEPIEDAQGRLAPTVIQRIVRQHFGRFRSCYEAGLKTSPNLEGTVSVKFVIKRDGSVSRASAGGDLPDNRVKECVRGAFATLAFPPHEGRETTVTYPIRLSPGGDTEPAKLPASPPPPTPSEASKADVWPIVVVDATRVLVDGIVTGDPGAVVKIGRLQKLDATFEALKARREGWKAQHPNAVFPGQVGIRADPDVPVLVLKSAFQTAAFAGYPSPLVQSSAEPSRIHELDAQIPWPPGQGGEAGPTLHVHLGDHEATLVWKEGPTVRSESRTAEAELGGKACEEWRTQGRHHDSADDQRDRLVLYASDALLSRSVFAALDALERCTRPLRGQDGAAGEVAAFRMTFSVR